MNGQTVFAYSVQGFNHIKKENEPENRKRKILRKFPCQDRSFCGVFDSLENDCESEIHLYVKNSSSVFTDVKLPVSLKSHQHRFRIICVSDGHGGPAHFRSDKGAEFAVTSLVELVSANIEKFIGCYEKNDFAQIEKGLSRGIAANRWLEKVASDLKSNPVTPSEKIWLEEDEPETVKRYDLLEKELAKIPSDDSKSILDFMRKSRLKEIYGCTFVAYIETQNFWYAFQIGDGDFAVSYGDGKFEKPIPEDENCVGNETTSLCGNDSFNDFRFAHGDRIPKTVFCNSDGISNSVRGDEGLFNLYDWYAGRFNDHEFEECKFCRKCDSETENFCDFNCRIQKAKKFIEENLPEQSEQGSKDDFSLAGKIEFSEKDRAKIRKWTCYRQFCQLKFYPEKKEEADRYLKESADSGNPFACCELANRIKNSFVQTLFRGIFDPKQKAAVLKYSDRAKEKGREIKLDLYLKIKDFIVSELKNKRCDRDLINETSDFFSEEGSPESKSALNEISITLADYHLSKLQETNHFDPTEFDFILKFVPQQNQLHVYGILQNVVDYQLRILKVDEAACQRLLDFYSKKFLSENRFSLYQKLFEHYERTGEEICSVLDFFDSCSEKSLYEKWKTWLGSYYFKRFRKLQNVDSGKAGEFLLKAVSCKNPDACLESGMHQYNSGKSYLKNGKLTEGYECLVNSKIDLEIAFKDFVSSPMARKAELEQISICVSRIRGIETAIMNLEK